MAAAAGNHCSTSTPIGGGGQAANNSSLPASCSMKRKKVHVLKKNNTENSIKVDNSMLHTSWAGEIKMVAYLAWQDSGWAIGNK